MSTNARRNSVPVAVRYIGKPPGTITGVLPVRPIVLPSDVSKHVSPASVYHTSGPECRWILDVIPGVNTASIYRAVYSAFGFTGSGPISATRTPSEERHSARSIVNSQILPRASTTALRDPFAASAVARDGYESKCQNIGAAGSLPMDRLIIVQHPISPVLCLTGRHPSWPMRP